MIRQKITEASIPVKKYLVKRKQMREEPLPLNSSIFLSSFQDRQAINGSDDPFRKYRTLTTKVENNSTLQSCAEGQVEKRLNSCRQDSQEGLPSISMGVNVPPRGTTLPVDIEKSLSPLRLKRKELTHHVSDPIYMRLEKTICRRITQKHDHYKRQWLGSSRHREDKDLLSRSFEKAAKNVKDINVDAQRRKNTIKLEEMLRDNILEKTFVFPGTFNPQISGLKGRGGKVIPLFQEVSTFQEVLKIDKRKR